MITTVSEQKVNELTKSIRDGILRKLDSARILVHYDKEVAAGLYTYAIEEFGKLLLVKENKLGNNLYEINTDWFKGPKAHKYKFPKAFDYLQQNNHSQCIALTEGDFVISNFYWRDFVIGLLADFEARLSIFYTDCKWKGNNDIDMVKVPTIDTHMLENAIKELEQAASEL